MAHPNARLTFHGRLQIVKHHRDGYTQATIAEMMGVSRPTVSKWLRRHAREGAAGLADRSSRPRQIAGGLSTDLVAAICQLRRERAVENLSAAHNIQNANIYSGWETRSRNKGMR